jgi:hypothetical protein
VLESASVSYGKATPYFPVLDLLRRYCHLDDTDDMRTVRAKVTGQILTLDTALQAHCHFGLGTLHARTGQRQQAHTELSAAITLYRAMDMTFWLPQAEAGLVQVSG